MSRCAVHCILLWAFFFGSGVAIADEPLHARIDSLIQAKHSGPHAAQTSDAEFLRRVYLDFAGKIPTVDEARAFLSDTTPDKRQRMIDSLLAGEDYPARMKDLFHVMLIERRGDHAAWSSYLENSFRDNKPWDQLVREILHSDPKDEATRGSAFFFSKRLEHYGQNPVDYPRLVRDIGRLFLGIDVQCAQCHNHPTIDDYHQVDYQGLYAYVGHTTLPRASADFPQIEEGVLSKKIEFVSVFTMDKGETGPRLPQGEEVAIQVFKKGEEFEPLPEGVEDPKKAIKTPKFSPLSELSARLPRPENSLFARNIVNRLWFVMMGRGLVHPLDLHHSANPPSHPELMDLLAADFIAHGFDVKYLLREMALSETYARSSVLPEGGADLPAESFAVAIEKPLSSEQLLKSTLIATGQWQKIDPMVKEEEKDQRQKKLAELQKRFIGAFAAPAEEPEIEFMPSVKAALFLLNGNDLQAWLEPADGNLVDRLLKLEDPKVLAEELYLATLTRKPTEEETNLVTRHLAKAREDRVAAVKQLAWALLTSTEACLNH